jgi:hypothetical protein
MNSLPEPLVKALRWFVLVFPSMVATYAALLVQAKDSVKPAIIIVLGYGLSFILGAAWKFMKGRVMTLTLIILGLCGLGAQYIPPLVWIYAGIEWNFSFFFNWTLLTFILGVPAMIFTFSKIKD